jgi:hypothetical protein
MMRVLVVPAEETTDALDMRAHEHGRHGNAC